MGEIVPLVLLACDLAGRGERLGRESIWRCHRALERRREILEYDKKVNVRIIVSAGMANPKAWPEQRRPLGIMMGDCLVSCGVPARDVVVGEETWGSYAELREAIRVIKAGNLSNRKGEFHPEVISGWYHCCRLRFIWRRETMAVGGSWHWTFVPVKGKTSSVLWELVKIPKEFLSPGRGTPHFLRGRV